MVGPVDWQQLPRQPAPDPGIRLGRAEPDRRGEVALRQRPGAEGEVRPAALQPQFRVGPAVQGKAEVVDREYATQRIVYALAALRDGAPRAEVAYCFLERPGEPVTRARVSTAIGVSINPGRMTLARTPNSAFWMATC